MKMVHLSICGTISTEEQRLHSLAEGSKQLTEVSQQDLQDNQNMLSQSSLHLRFESAANEPELPAEQYRQYIREMNERDEILKSREIADIVN